MDAERILILGGGGREHALAWRLSQDRGVREVLCAPGNAGTAELGRNLDLSPTDVPAVCAAARHERVDLVVVGPEAPLVAGVVEALAAEGIAAFGPDAAGARLEGSKVFAKELMARHGIPTAAFRVFDDAAAAAAYIRAADRPLVVKADGLAAGKGVVVAANADEAVAAIDLIMRRRAFGAAGDRVVVEELLRGQEVSYHVVSDGRDYVALAPAQDHKRIHDGDRGPNTGGMGAYSPPPIVDSDVERKILREVVEPTLAGMAADGNPFRGALFVGLMIDEGRPQVLEYNVRFGDPECQTLVTRWAGDFAPLLVGSAHGGLAGLSPAWAAPCSLCVVLAAGGYPADYDKGLRIEGLEDAARVPGATVFHAGTARADGGIVTAGGRVLSVTAVGDTVDAAAERAYRAADLVRFDGKHCRRDIGWRARTP